MANEIKITVKKIDTSELDKIGKAAKDAGKEAGTGLEKGFKDGEQGAKKALDGIEDKLDKTAQTAKQKGAEAGSGIGDGLKDGLKTGLKTGDIEGAIGGALEGLGGGVIAAAGVGIGALLLDGINRSFEQAKVGGMLAAQIGASSEQAGNLGHVAGQIFTDNFGESIAEVGEAMHAVFQTRLIDKNAALSDIKAVTEGVMTVAQVTGEAANSVGRAAKQMVRTGLADSVTEALDLITHAEQQGLNSSEDLLDTITEYSTKFRDLGLDGEEAFGLIQQAMEGGARDTDTAADALKEFAIRAQDGSVSTARGFQTIGLNAETMGAAIAHGGASAHQALGMTLKALESIHDPMIRDQAAVDLFGTKAEDLGDALFSMNLDGAKAKFGDFANAAQKAADEITRTTPPIEAAWKNVQAGINNALDFATSSSGLDEAQAKVKEATAKAIETQARLADSKEQQNKRAQEAADAWKTEGNAIHKVVETMDEYIRKQQQLQAGVLDLSNSEIAYQASVDDAAKSLKEHGKTLDINTEAGRANKQSLDEMAQSALGQIAAMQEQGSSLDELTGFTQTARDEFIRMAVGMGMSTQSATTLADRLRLIPGNYEAHVFANTAAASNSIETIRGNLINLTNRPWVASVSITGKGMIGGGKMFVGMEHGGVVGHAAEGGPRSNTILAGEHGIELIDVPAGSTVHSNPDTMRMLSRAGGGGSGVVDVHMHYSGDLDSYMAAAWMKAYNDGLIRIQGVAR